MTDYRYVFEKVKSPDMSVVSFRRGNIRRDGTNNAGNKTIIFE